tara:strand:+ start:5381 stop:7822 length:2442 start_codon:yes stop_codon:yes gene_type:complete
LFSAISPIAFVAPAFAQQTESGSADKDAIGDIIVTATRRSESIQNVPIAITAFTSERLQERSISDVRSLSSLAPSVNFDTGTTFSGSNSVLSASIRGIGLDDYSFSSDPGVGVYIEGVYLGRNIGANVDLLDVQRIEILRGPQGTLFGRNTIGGAVNIATRDPGDHFRIAGDATVGRYNRKDFRASVDVPLSTDVFANISFLSSNRDGYQKRIRFNAPYAFVNDDPQAFAHSSYDAHDTLGGKNRQALRGKLLWKPSSDLKITLASDYSHENESGSPTSLISTSTTGTFNSTYNSCLDGTGNPVLCGPRSQVGTGLFGTNVPQPIRLVWNNQFLTGNPDTTYATGLNFSHLKNYGASLTVEFHPEAEITVKSISSYRALNFANGVDQDGSPLPFYESSFEMEQHQYSQELQLLGTAMDSRLDYLLGAYFFNEGGSSHQQIDFAAGLQQIESTDRLNTSTYALYTHDKFKLTDRLSLILGARYSIERKKYRGDFYELNGNLYKSFQCYPPSSPSPVPGLTCTDFVGSIFGPFPDPSDPFRYNPRGTSHLKFSRFTWTAGMEYRVADDVMAYGTYSTGFKSGNWTTRLIFPVKTQPTFGPEKAATAEVGLKSQWFDKRLQLNLAGFRTAYKDIQLFVIAPGFTAPITINAGDARIWGIEAEANAHFGSGFELAGSLAWLDAKYTALSSGAIASGIGLNNELPKTPRWKATVGPKYTYALQNGGALSLVADYTYTSSIYNDTENHAILKRPSTNIINASLAYVAPGDQWELAVGSTNLTNKRYIVTGAVQPDVVGTVATYNAPSQWYATFRFKFGN